MHALGPQNTGPGRAGPGGTGGGVRQAIKKLFTAVEEAKADVSGLWALQKLRDKGVLEHPDELPIF